MRRPTIKDVAEKANVSGWTVSHVINRRADVSIGEDTRKRVLKVAAEIGYRPNHAARALVRDRSQLIALWMRTHEHPSAYYGTIEHHLQRLARENGYQCISEDVTLENVEQPEFSNLLNWPMDGVIACDASGPVASYTAITAYDRLPIVNLGVWVAESTDYVRLDLRPGSLDAVRHLIDIGCRSISYAGRRPHLDARAEAYADVLRENSLPENWIFSDDDSRSSAREAMLRYLQANPTPDGLFCENDEVAIGCYRALCELGIDVPEEVAIVGCDGIVDGEFQARTISTIKPPVYDLCKTAWTYLENRMKNPDYPLQQCVMAAKLEIRKSPSELGTDSRHAQRSVPEYKVDSPAAFRSSVRLVYQCGFTGSL